MAKEQIDIKIAFLLSPRSLAKDYMLLESFHIYKSSKGVDYETYDIDLKEIKQHHSKLPKPITDILRNFSFNAVHEKKYNVKNFIANNADNVDTSSLLPKTMLRYLFDNLNALKPYYSLLKFYHKIINVETKNQRVSPCSFSAFRPQLSFDVVKQNSKLNIETSIILNGFTYKIDTFNRHQFLLESNNEYFLLAFKDYQILEWLQENIAKHADDENTFAEHILSKIEGDYTVNRNNHFNKNEIEVIPENRILLSELNNSFLMLTPQWLYDGFIVEGSFAERFDTVQNGVAYSIKRNKEAEDSFIILLLSLHLDFAKQKNGYYYLSFANAQKKQWFLKAYHQLLDLNIQIIGMDMLQHFRYSSFKAETISEIKEQTDTQLILQLETSFGKEKVSLKELQKILLAGQRAVMLKDNSLGILSDEWLQQYAAIIKHGRINNNTIEVAKWMAILEDGKTNETSVLGSSIKQDWWQKWLQWQSTDKPVYVLPSTVIASLRPYQQKGFEWLALLAEVRAGGCLADDMGLGKTLQTICFLAYYANLHPQAKMIIVCPSSLIYNWQQELQKFTPSLKSIVYHGSQRKADDLLNDDVKVIITSYGTVRADNGSLLASTYGVAVVDESHNIKNPSAQITKAIGSLQAVIKIALSGTPVVNNTFDLYAQLNFALPGMFGSREFFKREYADAIDRNRDEEKIRALQKMTAPFILRRTKEQVAKDLPDKTESVLWCNMSARQRDVYNNISEQIRSNLFTNIENNGLNKSKLAVLQGIMKLRQVCNSPLLLPPEEQEGCKDSVKTEMLIAELQNILGGGHKALVFSQFSSMLNLLATECDKQGITYYKFDGQTPPAQRVAMVNEFQQEDSKASLFLISLKAGNTGLTLTAADYVFLFDPWWNTAIEQQAIDRTHRIGQTKNVFAYKIICKDTIEEKIIQLQARKKQLAEDLISEDEGFVKSLSEEDIAYLFS